MAAQPPASSPSQPTPKPIRWGCLAGLLAAMGLAGALSVGAGYLWVRAALPTPTPTPLPTPTAVAVAPTATRPAVVIITPPPTSTPAPTPIPTETPTPTPSPTQSPTPTPSATPIPTETPTPTVTPTATPGTLAAAVIVAPAATPVPLPPDNAALVAFLSQANQLAAAYPAALEGLDAQMALLDADPLMLSYGDWVRSTANAIAVLHGLNEQARSLTAPAVYAGSWSAIAAAADQLDGALDQLETALGTLDATALNNFRERYPPAQRAILDGIATLPPPPTPAEPPTPIPG